MCLSFCSSTKSATKVKRAASSAEGSAAVLGFVLLAKTDGAACKKAHGFDSIMLVTGLIHSRLNVAVKHLNRPSVSTIDVLIKAAHMRMVQEGTRWTLHNTRTKDIELFEAIGLTPDKEYRL